MAFHYGKKGATRPAWGGVSSFSIWRCMRSRCGKTRQCQQLTRRQTVTRCLASHRFEENEMERKRRHRETIGLPAIVAGVVILIVAAGSSSDSTAPAIEPIAAEFAVESQWDDEPAGNLEPAPKTERASKKYTWEQQHAKTDAKGGLVWMPKPFVFEAGDSVCYIDFEDGRDGNDGKTTSTAWKHHPWDGKATGQAASCTGVHTYVFKRGVYYRSTLSAQDSGQPGNPIRLTSDPSWGKGEAVICGSVKITGGWKKGQSIVISRTKQGMVYGH